MFSCGSQNGYQTKGHVTNLLVSYKTCTEVQYNYGHGFLHNSGDRCHNSDTECWHVDYRHFQQTERSLTGGDSLPLDAHHNVQTIRKAL